MCIFFFLNSYSAFVIINVLINSQLNICKECFQIIFIPLRIIIFKNYTILELSIDNYITEVCVYVITKCNVWHKRFSYHLALYNKQNSTLCWMRCKQNILEKNNRTLPFPNFLLLHLNDLFSSNIIIIMYKLFP